MEIVKFKFILVDIRLFDRLCVPYESFEIFDKKFMRY